MKSFILFFLVVMITGCASHGKKEKKVQVMTEPVKSCHKVAYVTSSGFSLIPYLGKMMAKSILEDKARELKANAIVITRESGVFYSELEADGFICKEVAPIKV